MAISRKATGRPVGQGRDLKVLLYSHDTFGLGHLRRCRAISGALTASSEHISALIITGSPVAGRFTFPNRVDYVRLPGVTKRVDGSYVSDKLGLDIDETTTLRSGLIKSLVEQFVPDLIIVDKEPTGFRGELLPALEWLYEHSSTRLVLGLRDILDSPKPLADEWKRKGGVEAVKRFYDEIWVYGLESIYDPTSGLELPADLRERMHWTGYLRRESLTRTPTLDEPYILVTPGGGGDGQAMVDLVLRAYEQDPLLKPKALLVFGPFLTGQARVDFEQRIAQLDGRIEAVGFESNMENLMAGAQGVVAMGGYNTFCEILSCDVPAIIVPRTVPRLEQYIRACRAEELGLVRMLDINQKGSNVESMITGIRGLPAQLPPSAGHYRGLLGGLDYIVKRVNSLVSEELEQERA
ncbi:MAG: hypothetical protein KTR32_24230 [Granulosicoccus sp.]|nr:hypothetical protein [Granulosicoccus sp.]